MEFLKFAGKVVLAMVVYKAVKNAIGVNDGTATGKGLIPKSIGDWLP